MLPELYVALAHAEYANFEDLLVCVHWGFAIPTWNFELSMLANDFLDKRLVNYVIILVARLAAWYGRELVRLLCICRALAP